MAIAEENKSEVPEEKDAYDGNAEKAITSNIIDNKSENLLAEAEPSPEEDASVSVPVQDVAEDDFSTVEEQPHFPGGDKALMDFIRKNLRYPALTQAYVTKGRVLMSMKIDTLGQVSDIKAMRFMLDYAPSLLSHTSETEQTELKADISRQLEEECARVIAMMPTWQPGRVMGNRTNMRYYIPFMLQPELLAKARESEKPDPLQGRIAGQKIVPNSSHLGPNSMRLTGTSAQNERGIDSVLVVVDGEATKPAPRTYEYEWLANAVTEEALLGRIAGLDLNDKPFHFVKETDRPALPHLWERDTVLTLVNGKED